MFPYCPLAATMLLTRKQFNRTTLKKCQREWGGGFEQANMKDGPSRRFGMQRAYRGVTASSEAHIIDAVPRHSNIRLIVAETTSPYSSKPSVVVIIFTFSHTHIRELYYGSINVWLSFLRIYPF